VGWSVRVLAGAGVDILFPITWTSSCLLQQRAFLSDRSMLVFRSFAAPESLLVLRSRSCISRGNHCIRLPLILRLDARVLPNHSRRTSGRPRN